MAWYEGNTSTYKFPGLLAELMQSTKKEDGSPAWELLSKNIEEPNTKDRYTGEGYVLKSTGKDGKSNILIRILPIIQSATNDAHWNLGAELGVVGSYIPGLDGANGTCTDVMACKLAYHDETALYPNCDANAMTRLDLLQYWISVTEERVIIVTKSRRVTDDTGKNIHFTCYLGEIDSINGYRTKACGSTYMPTGTDSKITGALGTLGISGLGGTETPMLGTIAISDLTCNASDVHYDTIVDVYPFDYKVHTQVVGSLKDMLYRRSYGDLTSGYVLPTSGYVEVDGEEYLCVLNRYRIHGWDSSFTPYSGNYYTLIRKG